MCAQTTGVDRKTGKIHRLEDGSDIGVEKKIVTQKLEGPTTHQSINQQQLQMQQVEKMLQLPQLPQLSHHQR